MKQWQDRSLRKLQRIAKTTPRRLSCFREFDAAPLKTFIQRDVDSGVCFGPVERNRPIYDDWAGVGWLPLPGETAKLHDLNPQAYLADISRSHQQSQDQCARRITLDDGHRLGERFAAGVGAGE